MGEGEHTIKTLEKYLSGERIVPGLKYTIVIFSVGENRGKH